MPFQAEGAAHARVQGQETSLSCEEHTRYKCPSRVSYRTVAGARVGDIERDRATWAVGQGKALDFTVIMGCFGEGGGLCGW
jgi:hypothetical protein